MDLVDLMVEKRFLGQEFLTWLWWKSEERGGTVAVKGLGDIAISLEKHMLLESGEGESSEKIICSGLQTELREARTGLVMGKKLEQARIVLTEGSYEYSFTLSGSLMEFRNVKLPKTEDSEKDVGQSTEEVEGSILERAFLFEQLMKSIRALFAQFLEVRVGDVWTEQVVTIRQWVAKNASI
jgi:recombination associated protein RdgC